MKSKINEPFWLEFEDTIFGDLVSNKSQLIKCAQSKQMTTQGYSRPSFQPMLQQYVDPAVAGWFRHVDTDRSGLIDAKELNSALSLGGWISFSVESTTAMIRMFNKDGT